MQQNNASIDIGRELLSGRRFSQETIPISDGPASHEVVPAVTRTVIEAEAVPDFMGDGVHPAHCGEVGEHSIGDGDLIQKHPSARIAADRRLVAEFIRSHEHRSGLQRPCGCTSERQQKRRTRFPRDATDTLMHLDPAGLSSKASLGLSAARRENATAHLIPNFW